MSLTLTIAEPPAVTFLTHPVQSFRLRKAIMVMSSKVLFSLTAVMVLASCVLSPFRASGASASVRKGGPEAYQHKPHQILLSFAGDCTFGTVNGDDGPNRFPAVYDRSGQLDYPFHLVRRWFAEDDFSVVNFECTLTNQTLTANKQWHFKGLASYANIFPAASVDLVGLSNNHSFDYLQAGFNDTANNFAKASVPFFYRDKPYVTTLNGIQTVFIGDCTVVGENTTLIDDVPARIVQTITKYKRTNNVVVVVMHWGSELDTVPRPWQQALGRKFIDAGADAVVGAHPHVL